MTLIYACIALHAGDLIPETVADQNTVAHTRQSMQQMDANLEALSPEVIVIINPHGFRVQGAVSISIAERASAQWSPEVNLNFEMDSELANKIADNAAEVSVPLARYIYGASGGPECFIPLDWGAVVPLYNTHGHKLRFPPSEKAQFVTECGIFHGAPLRIQAENCSHQPHADSALSDPL